MTNNLCNTLSQNLIALAVPCVLLIVFTTPLVIVFATGHVIASFHPRLFLYHSSVSAPTPADTFYSHFLALYQEFLEQCLAGVCIISLEET